jgi:hypothetical protein
MNLSNQLRELEPQVRPSPWSGYEHYKGYSVMVLPFSSGHLLGLRVFPENDFAPYKSVWHRTPAGNWSIYNDGPSLKTTCPRWWGPALEHTELAPIELTWMGPNTIHVEMEHPRLDWTMKMAAPLFLRVLNAMSATIPLWMWKFSLQQRMGEWIAKRLLKMGNDIRFTITTPSEQDAILIPGPQYFIETSEAVVPGGSVFDSQNRLDSLKQRVPRRSRGRWGQSVPEGAKPGCEGSPQ